MLPDPSRALRLGSVNLSGPVPVIGACGMLRGGLVWGKMGLLFNCTNTVLSPFCTCQGGIRLSPRATKTYTELALNFLCEKALRIQIRVFFCKSQDYLKALCGILC